ncbi:unnamed protein product [Discula destructiva]
MCTRSGPTYPSLRSNNEEFPPQTPPPPPTPTPTPPPPPCMVAPSTLHKFNLLPPELRNAIWEYSLPPPRVFDLYPASTSQKTPAQQGLRFANLHSEPPPPIAGVCRESRSLALHHYRPLTLCGTTKYVNLACDVLLLESCLFERNLLRTLLFMGKIPLIRDGLQRLAFGTSYGVHTGMWHPVLGWKKLTKNNMGRFLQRIGVFTALEKLVFVVHQEVQYEVAEMPYMTKILEGTGTWDGQVSRNATVYERGTTPPGPRMLMGSGQGEDDMSSRASTPSTSCSESSSGSEVGDASAGSFYRLPWTDERPWLPHENEIYYYPLQPSDDIDGTTDVAADTQEGQIRPRGPSATNEDWLCFRRTLKRDLETGINLGLAVPRRDTKACQKRKRDSASGEMGCGEGAVAALSSIGSRPCKFARGSGVTGDEYKLPEIQGANFLWRYALPS